MPTPTLSAADEATHTRHVVNRLVARYAGRHSAEYVTQVVAGVHERLADARIRTFVPILVEHMAREALDASARPGSDTIRRTPARPARRVRPPRPGRAA